MSLQLVRAQYGVPARLGALIDFQGRRGRIVGASRANLHLRVRMTDNGGIVSLHPTWQIDYLDGRGIRS